MAKRDRASEEFLAELHNAFAQVCLKRLKADDISAADLGVIRQFLKDNNITSVPSDDSPLANLLGELPDFTKDEHMN